MSMGTLNHLTELIGKYVPYLYYTQDEVCFPISIEKYLDNCELRNRDDPIYVDPVVTSTKLFDLSLKFKDRFYLNFKNLDWKEDLKGDPQQPICYVKVQVSH